MAAAGVGEDDGLRAHPAESDLPAQMGLDADNLPTGNGPTQLLPTVRRDPDSPAVRAVARRVASALPALGRDGSPEVPHSARVTADRRRQAVAKASGAPATPELPDTPPAPSAPAPSSSAASAPAPSSSAPSALGTPTVFTASTASAAASALSAALNEPTAATPIVTVSPPTPPTGGAATRPRHAQPDEEAVVALTPETEPAVVAPAPAPDVPTPARDVPASESPLRRPALMGQPGVVDAEVIDEARDLVVAGGGRPVVTAAVAAEMVSALTEVAFREARADEWVVAEPGLPDVPSTALEPVSTGPRVLDADSWDTSVQPLVDQDYQGRRRAVAGSARLWIVVGLVVAALSAAIGVPFLLTSGTLAPAADRSAGASPGGLDDGDVISGTSSPGAGSSGGATGIPPVGASPLVTASETAVATATTAPATASPSPTTGTPPLDFTPITIEAEAAQNIVSGSASRSSYVGTSGGQIVGYIGKVDTRPAGTLTITGVTVPTAGTYVVKFFYISNAVRTGYIAANGGPATSIISPESVNCCGTGEVQLTLDTRAGGNTITFSNPTARAPAIDKIVISKV